jgi:uncharacterized protein with PQ loop repeat
VIVEMLAWFGAALSCLLCIPQAARTLHVEQLNGVSASTYWIALANAAVWAAWSLLTGEYAAGAPALVSGPAAVLILRRLAAARRRTARLKHGTTGPSPCPVGQRPWA